MSATDIVSIFSEGTFEEQIRELVVYVAGNRSEDERAAFLQPFQDALKTEEGAKPISEDEARRIQVLSLVLKEVKGLGDGSDREVEGFSNLLYSHLLSAFSSDSPELKEHVTSLLQTISSDPREPLIKCRILSNLFNALPRRSPLRLAVYQQLLDIAVANDELEVLQISRTDVEKWIKEWDVTPEQKSQLLKNIVDAFTKAGQPGTAYLYQLSYVRSLPSSSPEAQSAAVDAIATALRLPSVFDFDPLFKLDAVMAAKAHEIFSLLQVFLDGGLPELQAWEQSHPEAFQKYGLDKAQLERKMRLLVLSSVGLRNVGHDLAYAEIASALQVDPSEVEKWVIDVIRAGLVSGKLSQTTQTLHVTRSTARSFERDQWEALEKRLVAWKTGLEGVLEVVAAAQASPKRDEPPVVQAQAVAPVEAAAQVETAAA